MYLITALVQIFKRTLVRPSSGIKKVWFSRNDWSNMIWRLKDLEKKGLIRFKPKSTYLILKLKGGVIY